MMSIINESIPFMTRNKHESLYRDTGPGEPIMMWITRPPALSNLSHFPVPPSQDFV